MILSKSLNLSVAQFPQFIRELLEQMRLAVGRIMKHYLSPTSHDKGSFSHSLYLQSQVTEKSAPTLTVMP